MLRRRGLLWSRALTPIFVVLLLLGSSGLTLAVGTTPTASPTPTQTSSHNPNVTAGETEGQSKAPYVPPAPAATTVLGAVPSPTARPSPGSPAQPATSTPNAKSSPSPKVDGSGTFTVTATGGWVNTGITTNIGDMISVSASGSWNPGSPGTSAGPDGQGFAWADNFLNVNDLGACSTCATTYMPWWGGLVGYIGNNPPAPGSYTSTSVRADAQRVFGLGSGNYLGPANAPYAGTLWIGFNDDAYSGITSDNSGSISATVTVQPGGVSNDNILASFIAPLPTSGTQFLQFNGRAVAFDGTNVWYNVDPGFDTGETQIFKVAPTTGTLLQTLNPGVDIASLAWDSKRSVLWAGAYDSTGKVYQINPATGAATLQFTFVPRLSVCYGNPQPGNFDGLAYDPNTDSLWISDDAAHTVYNFSVTGTQLSSFPMTNTGYDCSSGIGLAGTPTSAESLWLASTAQNNSTNSYIVHSDFTGKALAGTFTTGLYNPEGVAYDSVTFAPKCALWANQATDNPFLTLIAFQVPCSPSVEPAPNGTNHNYPDPVDGGVTDGLVHTYTGNFGYVATDLAIPGRGPSLDFARTYNSDDTRVGPLGPGWTHSYNIRIRAPSVTSDNLVATGPYDRTDTYTFVSAGTFSAPPAVYTTLTQNTDGTYTEVDPDQTTRTFDSRGNLTAIADRYGNTVQLTYSPNGELSTISDPAGRGVLTLAYDTCYLGRLCSVADWNGRAVTYGYDASGRLASVTDRDNQVTSYGYDANNHLTTITDADTHVAVTNSYDAQGRVLTQKDALGLTTGQQTSFSYVSGTTTVTLPTTSLGTNWQPTVADTYDSQGRLTQRVAKPSSTETITTHRQYDTNSNISTTTDGLGNLTTYCYDRDYAGNVISTSHGNLTRVIQPPPSQHANPLVTLFKYDAKNNLVETVEPAGVTKGAVTCTTNLSTSINNQFAVDNAYDANLVTLQSTSHFYTTSAAATTRFEYNDPSNPGQITRIIPPNGNTGGSPDYSFATSFTYYTSGSQAGMLQSATDPLGNEVTYTYDAVGREVTMVDPNGNASGGVPADHTWSYAYDNEDRLTSASAPPPLSGGAALTTTYTYDPVGNLSVVKDTSGQVTKYLYDVRDSLMEVDQSPNAWTDPNTTPSPEYVTTYSYDNLGNLTRVKRAAGDATYESATDYAYDGLDRLRTETQYPSWPTTSPTLVTTYTYDANSNLKTLVDPLTKTTTYGYDPIDRVTSVGYSDGTPNVSYGYDANGNRTSMSDGTGATSYAYNPANQLTNVTSPGNRQASYTYDASGNRLTVGYPDSTVVTYIFNKGDQLQSFHDWAQRQTTYQYNADGSLHQTTNVNGTTATYLYDNAQRLTQVLNQNSAGTISQHSYTLDPLGNRTQVAEVLAQKNGGQQNITTPYKYDSLSRLIDVNNGVTTYTYNPVGNRISKNLTTYSYDRADRILAAGSTTYTPDADGNVTARGSDTFTYDQANRLKSATVTGESGTQTGTYVYNGDGNRASKTVGTTTTNYVYDIDASLSKVLTDGTLKYVYGLDLAYAVDSAGNVQVYHTDGLGSVRAITDANGNLIETYQTDEFGNPTQTQGTSTQSFQYTGQQSDAESGLYYLRARMYDANTGRFLSRDPLGGAASDPLSLNRFIYVRDNPMSGSDPGGHEGGAPCDPHQPEDPCGMSVGPIGPIVPSAGEGSIPSESAQGGAEVVQELPPSSGEAAPRSPAYEQVPLGSTDLSERAIALRLKPESGGYTTRNVAVFEYQVGSELYYESAFSIRLQSHAEKVVGNRLQEFLKIDPSQVTRIYSEFEPCTNGCRPWIAETFPNADVSWSFPYSDAGRVERVRALRELYRPGG